MLGAKQLASPVAPFVVHKSDLVHGQRIAALLAAHAEIRDMGMSYKLKFHLLKEEGATTRASYSASGLTDVVLGRSDRWCSGEPAEEKDSEAISRPRSPLGRCP